MNDLNARTIQTIRKTNPTRIVLFSGNNYSNSDELVAAAVPADSFLIGYYHSYDPWPFGLRVRAPMARMPISIRPFRNLIKLPTWGAQHNLPVVLSEFGYTYKCEYNSRMCAYATVAEQAQLHNVSFLAWEDGGDFKFYNRTQHTWSEIKDVLIHTYKESPNKMRISAYGDTSIRIQWNNRTTENDSIIVERRLDSTTFAFLAKIAPTASQFIDSTTSSGKKYTITV